MNYYTTNSDPTIEEGAKAICVLLVGIITLIAWGYGIYHFGIEAYASGWEIGKVAILALWTICSGPIIAGGLYLVTLLLSGLVLLLLAIITRK